MAEDASRALLALHVLEPVMALTRQTAWSLRTPLEHMQGLRLHAVIRELFL